MGAVERLTSNSPDRTQDRLHPAELLLQAGDEGFEPILAFLDHVDPFLLHHNPPRLHPERLFGLYAGSATVTGSVYYGKARGRTMTPATER